MRLEKILVPVDFSECSWAALEYAAYFAKRFNAAIHVLHVWETPPYIDPRATIKVSDRVLTLAEFVRTEAGKDMQRFMKSLERLEGAVDVLCRLESGDPANTILKVATEGYGIIIMGTHGRTGLAHLLLGSIAEKVIRRAECPVLTVCRPEATSSATKQPRT